MGDSTLPLALVDDYLDLHGDRFDLLDPVTPFMQVADLTTASGKTSGREADR
ncbi:MAG: type I-E CRISPR-associated protein Cse1/CasA [Micropruina sp.]|nr:type I-E CRISPR-associated protein Cse1/CasA [Micropruina sp.]